MPRIRRKPSDTLPGQLRYLNLPFVLQQYEPLAQQAAQEQWPHVQYLTRLIDGEAALRQDRSTQRRIKQARFPVLKTYDQFDFTWPSKINRMKVQDLFRLRFVEEKANLMLIGGVGLGKTHLAIALGYAACLAGHRVLFTSAVNIVNHLTVAQKAGRLGLDIKRYLKPEVLVVDELGYLPIDKHGADLLFQIISNRYESGSMIVTSNKAFKQWPSIFNNDATLTSALLDRLLHHAETLVIEGKSFRMKDQTET
jgi:DNA replication protein DnaC